MSDPGHAKLEITRCGCIIRVTDNGVLHQLRYIMPKNTPPPICSLCSKTKRFLLRKTGGRKFQCLDCEGDDPLRSAEVAKLLTGELKPLD